MREEPLCRRARGLRGRMSEGAMLDDKQLGLSYRVASDVRPASSWRVGRCSEWACCLPGQRGKADASLALRSLLP